MRLLALAVALAATTGTVRAQEATLLAEEAAAIVPVEGLSRLVVRGVKGSVDVRKSTSQGEIRILSLTADPKRDPLPVAVWSDATSLRIEPRSGAADVAHALQIYLPQGLDLRLDLDGAAVDIAELSGDLEVHGKRLELAASAIAGGVVADLEGGSAAFASIGREVRLQGTDLRLEVRDAKAGASLTLRGGDARVGWVKGVTRVESDRTTVAIEEASTLTLKSKGGTASLVGVVDGGLSLTGTPLNLQRVRGEFDVQTDGEVRFKDCQAALHFDGYGASVTGSGNSGLVEVRTQNSAVQLERIDGPVRVEGEGLKVRLSMIEGDTFVLVRGSEVEVEGNKDHLVVESTDGNVTVRQSTAPVEVRAVGGNVLMLDLRASADLRAESESAEVSWAALPTDKDSFLENTGGDIRVRFPATGSCRIEAQSKSGKIESELELIGSQGEGNAASALIGRGPGKTIEIRSRWDIHLYGGPPRAEPRP